MLEVANTSIDVFTDIRQAVASVLLFQAVVLLSDPREVVRVESVSEVLARVNHDFATVASSNLAVALVFLHEAEVNVLWGFSACNPLSSSIVLFFLFVVGLALFALSALIVVITVWNTEHVSKLFAPAWDVFTINLDNSQALVNLIAHVVA